MIASIGLLILFGLIVIAVILVVWAIATYNGLVQLRNQLDNAWAQIDVQLKRRYDLIPNRINKPMLAIIMSHSSMFRLR